MNQLLLPFRLVPVWWCEACRRDDMHALDCQVFLRGNELAKEARRR